MPGTCKDTYNNYGSYLKSRGTDKAVCELNSKIIANTDTIVKNTNAIEAEVTRAEIAEDINADAIAINKTAIEINAVDISANKTDIETNKTDIEDEVSRAKNAEAILTQQKASLSGATFTGNVIMNKNLNINGDLMISGTTTTVNTQNLDISSRNAALKNALKKGL